MTDLRELVRSFLDGEMTLLEFEASVRPISGPGPAIALRSYCDVPPQPCPACRAAVGDNASPWPLVEILERLGKAVQHLLDVHGCDAHGYELDRTAANAALALASQLRLAQHAPGCPNASGGEGR